MPKENMTSREMLSAVREQQLTSAQLREGLVGKLLGPEPQHPRRTELETLQKWGIDANALTLVVFVQAVEITTQLEHIAQADVSAQEIALIQQAIPEAVAAEKALQGSGREFLFGLLGKLPEKYMNIAILLLALVMLTGCLLSPDSAQAATATPDQAATLDLDDTEQSLDAAATPTKRPTVIKTPTATRKSTTTADDTQFTAAATVTPTREQIRPTPTETPEPTPTPIPERLDVEKISVEKHVVVIGKGINIRKAPSTSAEIAFQTQGEVKIETTVVDPEDNRDSGFKVADGYTWIELKLDLDGDNVLGPEDRVWVAYLNSSVSFETVQVLEDAVGGEVSNAELVAEARKALGEDGTDISAVYQPGAYFLAIDRTGRVLGVKIDDTWQPTVVINGPILDTEQRPAPAAEADTSATAENRTEAQTVVAETQAALEADGLLEPGLTFTAADTAEVELTPGEKTQITVAFSDEFELNVVDQNDRVEETLDLSDVTINTESTQYELVRRAIELLKTLTKESESGTEIRILGPNADKLISLSALKDIQFLFVPKGEVNKIDKTLRDTSYTYSEQNGKLTIIISRDPVFTVKDADATIKEFADFGYASLYEDLITAGIITNKEQFTQLIAQGGTMRELIEHIYKSLLAPSISHQQGTVNFGKLQDFDLEAKKDGIYTEAGAFLEVDSINGFSNYYAFAQNGMLISFRVSN